MQIELKDITEMLEYQARNKDLIFRIILKRINDNLYTNIERVFLFNIFLTDYSIMIENVIRRDEFLDSLNYALDYFEEQEDYETCQEVKMTIDIIEGRKLLNISEE